MRHMRDESIREVKAWMATISTWPLWVYTDDAVDVYTTTEMSELLLSDPEYGGGVMREAKLCYDGAELTEALAVWWPDLA